MFIEEQPIKLIRLRMKTYQKLREHNRYFHPRDNNRNSFDGIIATLMDFYEKNKKD